MIKKFSNELVIIDSVGENNFSGMIDYHYHEQTELYFLLSGDCKYFIGNKIYSVSSKQLVVIPAFMIHKTTYSSKKRSRILLSLKKDFLDFEPLIDLTKPQIFRFDEKYNNEILNIISKIEMEIEKKDSLSKKMCKCLCYELFAVIARNAIKVTKEENTKSEDVSMTVEKITAYISEHYMENITLTGVSKEVGLSSAYLSKLFKKVTGLGFKEYLITIRILNAKKLLKETSLPVSTIAFDCGFNDSNYFSKMFHMYSHNTPLGYRKEKSLR